MTEASVLVVGAGAIGGVTAAHLTRKEAARRVAVLDANEEHVRLMREPGLRLDELGEEQHVRLDAHSNPAELEGEFDFALLTLKAPHLEAAIGPLRERGLASTFVSLGNGLVQDRVVELAGGESVLAGTVEWGATNLGPGHLAQTTRAPFVIGELDGNTRERTRLLARVLERAFEVRVTENIQGQIWTKLLVNSTFSGLGVVSGLLYREISSDPAGKEAAYALWREGFDVGMAQSLSLEEFVGVTPEDLVVRSQEDRQRADEALSRVMSVVGATKASMLQDLERRLKTEVDVINGGVVQRGREYGVPTPLNSRVVDLVHAMERGERTPSRDVFDELESLAK